MSNGVSTKQGRRTTGTRADSRVHKHKQVSKHRDRLLRHGMKSLNVIHDCFNLRVQHSCMLFAYDDEK